MMNTVAWWRERQASGNPVYPFEWEVRYANGDRFPRVCAGGRVRVTAQAPRAGIVCLRVRGPSGVVDVVPGPGTPDAIIVRARVRRMVAALDRGAIDSWRFGFRHGDRFIGVILDPSGRVTRVEAPWSRLQ
jgi:hypothetical protein